jgi:dihydrofolate reductase
MPRVTLIVARAANGVIGVNNTLPWRLPEDLKHFKATTLGHAVLMGRRTYESIGRPLPGRRNLVLSRQTNWHAEGCERVGSLDEAIARCADNTELFIAGGAEVYRQALARADRAIITDIDLKPAGDAFFAPLDTQQWEPMDSSTFEAANGQRFRISHYQRRTQFPSEKPGESA